MPDERRRAESFGPASMAPWPVVPRRFDADESEVSGKGTAEAVYGRAFRNL